MSQSGSRGTAPVQSAFRPISRWFDVNSLSLTFVFPVSNVVLTAIPKNGCTAMKSALLESEGIAVEAELAGVVHSAADDFRVMTEQSVVGRTSMIALRDPLARARSAYLEKLVAPRDRIAPFARRVVEAVWAGARGQEHVPADASITFREFVNYLHFTRNDLLDPHFRPQSDFWCLDYDHVIDLDIGGHLERTFADVGVPFTPRWEGTTRGLEVLDLAPGSGCDVPGEEWRPLVLADRVPPLSALLNDFLHERLCTRYADDIALRHAVLGR